MTEPTEPQEAPELIPVRVLATEGRSSLVEIEGPRRYYVPAGKIADGHVSAGTLVKALEYGIRWEAFLEEPDVTPDTLAAELRKAGIWTRADLTRLDRKLIRIASSIISEAVFKAADRAEHNKLPRRKKNG